MTHRKTIRHFHNPGELHELTFSCYRQLPLLGNDVWLAQLARCVDAACDEATFDLVAFVFMRDHAHLLVYPRGEPDTVDVGRFLARVKQPFSKYVKQSLPAHSPLLAKLIVRERPSKTCFRFWQEGPGYDRNLSSAAVVEASIDYIHCNPVKRGLCQRAIDWKWSSARWYLGDPPRREESDLPRIAGLPAGLFA